MSNELIFILAFVIFIFLMMAADLGLFGKSEKPVSLKQAGLMSAVWIAFALSFYALLYNYGHLLHHVDSFAALQQINQDNQHSLKLNPGDFAGNLQAYRKNLSLEFITGYIVEYALSVD